MGFLGLRSRVGRSNAAGERETYLEVWGGEELADDSLEQIKMLDEVIACLEKVLAGVEVRFYSLGSANAVQQRLTKSCRPKQSKSSWSMTM